MNWQIKNRTKQIKSITSQNTSGGDLNEKWPLWEDFPQKRPGILRLGWWCGCKERAGRRSCNTIASEPSGKEVKTTTSKVCRVSDSSQELMVFFCVVSYFRSWQVLLSSCSQQNLHVTLILLLLSHTVLSVTLLIL